MTWTQIVAAVRSRLSDTLPTASGEYLWSNDDLMTYGAGAVNELCREVPLIEDATTAALVTFSLLAGAHTIALSERVTRVQRARLTSQTQPLRHAVNVAEMDAMHPGWENSEAGAPSEYLTDGVGTNRLRIWPPTELADTLNLTVARIPLVDPTWAADAGNSPEIPSRYHELLYEGMVARAYLKDDTDTQDLRKAATHATKWRDAIDAIKRAEERRRGEVYLSAPHPGMI